MRFCANGRLGRDTPKRERGSGVPPKSHPPDEFHFGDARVMGQGGLADFLLVFLLNPGDVAIPCHTPTRT